MIELLTLCSERKLGEELLEQCSKQTGKFGEFDFNVTFIKEKHHSGMQTAPIQF
jgi:hypothetical protein